MHRRVVPMTCPNLARFVTNEAITIYCQAFYFYGTVYLHLKGSVSHWFENQGCLAVARKTPC